MSKFILPRFGETKLKDVREQDLQALLNELAEKNYSESVVKNTRIYLRGILAEATETGILPVNPAARIVRPRNSRKPTRSWLSIEQYQAILAVTESVRDRLMMKVFYIGGLRRGELLGLQWRDFDGVNTLHVERQVHANGTVGPAKTDGSIAPISIPVELASELNDWRKWCPNPKPDGWIFSSARGAHINPGMWRRNVLLPAGQKIGIPKLNYHTFRRGFATEANAQGMNDKAIQGQLRHASVNTTRDIYMQTVPTSQREAVEKFATVVSGKGC